MEIIMGYEIAIRLGARLPRDIQEHRTMRHSGRFFLIRARENALPFFWEADYELLFPGLAAPSSRAAKQ
jgi:hypothetical protein